MSVQARGELELATGVYYIDQLNLEPESVVELDQTAGPVTLYVKSQLTWRGTLRSSNGATPALLLGYFGTGTAQLQAPFVGTVIAPNGTLQLGTTSSAHSGVFFAKRVSVEAHTQVTYLAPVGS